VILTQAIRSVSKTVVHPLHTTPFLSPAPNAHEAVSSPNMSSPDNRVAESYPHVAIITTRTLLSSFTHAT
ncbi:hypothetical protein KYX90_13880, partial [Enterococcus lactis]|uniref:hypothetical protein n=1 Tax=Enterococcus lactis TaxID=357441 RepID=UPI001C7E0163